MKLYEAATIILVAAAVYWVVNDWLTDDPCLYTITVESMQVQAWDECGMSEQQVISNFKQAN